MARQKDNPLTLLTFCHRSDVLSIIIIKNERPVYFEQKRVTKERALEYISSLFASVYFNCTVSEELIHFKDAKQIISNEKLNNKKFFEMLIHEYPEFKFLVKPRFDQKIIYPLMQRRRLVYLYALTLALAFLKRKNNRAS